MIKIFSMVFVSLFLISHAHSATKTWDGGGADGNWRTAENWDGDTAPSSDDDLIFPAESARFATSNDFFLFTNFNSLTIEGGNYTVGGNPFRLMTGLTVNGGTHSINTAISLLSPQTFIAAQGAVATIAAVEFSGFNFGIDGAGAFGIGLIAGTGNIEKNGLGASLIATATNYNGAVTINDGILIIDATIPNAPVLVNAQTLNNGFGLSGIGGTGTVGSTHIVNGGVSAGTLTSPTGILSINGNFDIKENGIVAVKIGGTTPGENGHDQFKVTGSVILNDSVLTPIPFGSFVPAINDEFIIIDNDGNDPIQGEFLNAPEGTRFGGALNSAFEISYLAGDGNDVAIKAVNRAVFDFDGDGKSDISLFRPPEGTWNILKSADSNIRITHFGLAGDKITPADFDGDTKADIAVFRPSTGIWYVLNSSDSTVVITRFGIDGDLPVPNDFDGDGRADLGVFRPSTGIWYQLRSLGNQFFAQRFGLDGDIPLMGDYDGDGLGDLAIYRNGFWHLFRSADNSYTVIQLGIATDVPVPGDYNGDGTTDFAVFRATADSSQPDFYILTGNDFDFSGVSWGSPGDIPTVADYDGDGKTDIGVFRPSSNNWFLLQSTTGFTQHNFGQTSDTPIPSAYNP